MLITQTQKRFDKHLSGDLNLSWNIDFHIIGAFKHFELRNGSYCHYLAGTQTFCVGRISVFVIKFISLFPNAAVANMISIKFFKCPNIVSKFNG